MSSMKKLMVPVSEARGGGRHLQRPLSSTVDERGFVVARDRDSKTAGGHNWHNWGNATAKVAYTLRMPSL